MWLKILTIVPALWTMIKEIVAYFKKPKQDSCSSNKKDV